MLEVLTCARSEWEDRSLPLAARHGFSNGPIPFVRRNFRIGDGVGYDSACESRLFHVRSSCVALAFVCLLLVGCQGAEKGSGSGGSSAAPLRSPRNGRLDRDACRVAAVTPTVNSSLRQRRSAAKPPVTPPNPGPFYQGDARTLLSKEELADGWIVLFDGETLYGWEPATHGQLEGRRRRDHRQRRREGTAQHDDRVGRLRFQVRLQSPGRRPTAASFCGRPSSRPIRRRIATN